MSELMYRTRMYDYLHHGLTVDKFIKEFTNQWKHDREDHSFDPRFPRLIDRLFTSCDCYCEDPKGEFELSEMELKKEIQLLTYLWWGHY